MLQITLHEILTKVKNKRTKIEKIKCLRKYDTPELRSILKSSFDPNIVWLLPVGEVPYNQREFHLGDGSHKFLADEVSSLYNFIQGGNSRLKTSKREQMFIELLECLHETEAKLLIIAKDKKLGSIYKISDVLVKEAFKWNDKYNKL